MADQIIAFTPSTISAFEFQATLDGTSHRCYVEYNLGAERQYLRILNGSGKRVLYLPLIASPLTRDINIVNGWFKSSKIMYRKQLNQIEIKD